MNLSRRHRVAASFASAVALSGGATAFTSPPQHANICIGCRRPVFLATRGDDSEADLQTEASSNLLEEFAKPLAAAATSGLLVASLLFSNPLLPPPEAHAAVIKSQTATSVDIDLKSFPSLARKAVVNRDKLTNYLIDSFKSFKPILDLLSESDTVAVTPPKDVKGAINEALTKGEAEFLVNGQSVDVRVESVPGSLIIRVINPNIPRLPFLRDGTAALKFVDEIVDVAPGELEKAAEEVQAIEKFLMWGAPTKAPIQYQGSSLDYFLSSKFMWNGQTISLGSLGELTNSEVVFLGVGTGVIGAYTGSYAYYVSLKEEAEREAAEKKKAKAAADAKKKKADKAKADADAQPVEAKKVESKAEVEPEKKVAEETTPAKVEAPADTTSGGRKRDKIKNLFRRG
ncbi:hypothetical protein ACHAXT_009730 [Thalassiosira profunda]